jgi:hypothetical protein
MKKIVYFNLVFVVFGYFLLSCNGSGKTDTNKNVSKDTTIIKEKKLVSSTDTIDIGLKFYPSGWMGDGEKHRKKSITFQDNCNIAPHTPPVCFKINYKSITENWAGIYWQNKPDNWGDKPGEDFSNKNYSKISFYAKGETGNELIEFKAGDINANGKKYKDSFEKSLGKIVLSKDWKEYVIKLDGKDLSCVIGGFCWVATSNVTFYLDDIKIE